MTVAGHDKHALHRALVSELEAALSRMETSANETRRGAIHEESRPENDKDTRGLEASYLARGQAQRVAELAQDVDRVRKMPIRSFSEDTPAALSAVVRLERDDAELRTVFLAPAGGGVILEGSIRVVTPATPLARAIVGKRCGEELTIMLAGKPRTFAIVELT
jgi:transcription elongation GreA/GreB family factor